MSQTLSPTRSSLQEPPQLGSPAPALAPTRTGLRESLEQLTQLRRALTKQPRAAGDVVAVQRTEISTGAGAPAARRTELTASSAQPAAVRTEVSELSASSSEPAAVRTEVSELSASSSEPAAVRTEVSVSSKAPDAPSAPAPLTAEPPTLAPASEPLSAPPELPLPLPALAPAVPAPTAPAPAEAPPLSRLQTPTQLQWDAYLCRLKSLPSVKVATPDGQTRYWDNLYDYYAEQFAVNSTVDTLAQIEYCSARAILIEFAQLLDKAIAEEQRFWNFRRDPDELRLLTTLRAAL